MTGSRSKIESRAGRLLQSFDRGMFYDYSKKTRLLKEQCRIDADNVPSLDYVEDEIVTGEKFPAFYLQFNEPVYVTLANPLSLFRNLSGRFAGKRGSEHFFFQYGLIPVYFASMNTMSILKLYQTRADRLFDPTSTFFDGIKCVELSNKKGPSAANPVKYSSLNIIEQSTAKETLAEDMIANWFYHQYFTYGFWLQPRRGFTPATHMEFGDKMNAVFKLSKSVYAVDKVGQKETINVAGKDILVYNTIIRGVWVDTLHFGFPFNAQIEASILDEITDREPGKFPLLNGVMMEIRDSTTVKEKNFHKILTVSAGHGLSYFDLIQLASGLLCYRICRDNGAISRLLSVKGFQENVERTCKNWVKEAKTSDNFSFKADDVFNTAIEMMFPMVISDHSFIYFTHPLVIGFMKKWNLIFESKEVQKSVLLLLLPLLEKIFSLPWNYRSRITDEKEYEELQKFVGGDSRFSSSLIRLVKEINLSNIIRKTYQTEFPKRTETKGGCKRK